MTQQLPQLTDSNTQRLFEQQAPAGYLDEWAIYLAASLQTRDQHGVGVILFALGEEMFAWPAAAIHASLKARAVHVLPHHHSPLLLGIVHARGVLLPCMSLARLLCQQHEQQNHTCPLLMVGEEKEPYLFAVNKLTGFCRYQAQDLIQMPLQDDEHQGCYSLGMFEHQGKSIALLDPDLIIAEFRRQL